MEHAEAALPFQSIANEHIYEVVSFQNEISSIRYWRDKNARFREAVPALTKEAEWLLTFSVWFCGHNSRFFAVESSKYFTLEPAQEVSCTFTDFITLLNRYNRVKVTHKNEIHLVNFLKQCDRQHFDFYLTLLSKSFTGSLPKTEIYDVLDMGSIDLQDIYGSIEILNTSFSELRYPVAVTMLPDPDYNLVVQAREPKRTFSYYQRHGKLKATKDLVSIDAKYINTPRYTIIGYSDVKMIMNRKKKEVRRFIYPLDYFNTFNEYRAYVRTKSDRIPYTPFKERIENLREFLKSNYTRQIVPVPLGYAENEEQLTEVVMQMYPKDNPAFVIVYDNNTARNGKAVAIPVAHTHGIIHDLWIDSGIPKGFIVWFNAELHNIRFDFSGANNAILNSPDAVKNKTLEFTYLKIGPTEVFIASRINWEHLQWKLYRSKGAIFVEKCALCGGTDHKHKNSGMCHVCDINIRKYFNTYGANQWIKPSRQMQLKRGNSGWSHRLLDVLKPAFMGHYIESREDGYWRFRYDEEREKQYHEYLRILSTRNNKDGSS